MNKSFTDFKFRNYYLPSQFIKNQTTRSIADLVYQDPKSNDTTKRGKVSILSKLDNEIQTKVTHKTVFEEMRSNTANLDRNRANRLQSANNDVVFRPNIISKTVLTKSNIKLAE